MDVDSLIYLMFRCFALLCCSGILRNQRLMSGVTAGVIGLTLAIALFAGPLYRLCERAAADATDPLSYLSAVLP